MKNEKKIRKKLKKVT